MTNITGDGFQLNVPDTQPVEINGVDVADYPAAYAMEQKDSVRRAWRQADAVLKDPPKRLTAWLDQNNFPLVPVREQPRNSIYRRLKKAQIWDSEARPWMNQSRRTMKAWEIKALSPKVINELLWRLLPDQEEYFKQRQEQRRSVSDAPSEEVVIATDGMDFLPAWAKWIVMHPGLNVPLEEAIADPVVKERCEAYENAHPCPNQGTKNMLDVYRGDPKGTKEFFKEVVKFYSDDVKRRGKDEDEEEEMLDRAETLEEALGAM